MSRIAYVNGNYLPHRAAAVHIEDRGYQLADAVYEVCEVSNGYILDLAGHLDRLDRSLSELRIAWPMHRSALEVVMKQVIRRNRLRDGMVYLQVSRGVAPRDHAFPVHPVRPALVVTVKRLDQAKLKTRRTEGIKVITVPENRWERVDIKTTGLLANVLAKQIAVELGAGEAWFVADDGTVMEGSSSNAWIVTMQGELITREADWGILRGITRSTVMRVAEHLGLKVVERPFTVEEALAAREAFITSATARVTPVIAIDGKAIANGRPGSISQSLLGAFFDIAEKTPA